MVASLLGQARAAEAAGFNGLTCSEHHGGFGGYLPSPLQVVSWMLSECPGVWSAPAPLLLPLRPARLVAEEAAWLAARFPGRVGLGVAAGSLQQDFDIADVALGDDLGRRFAEGLAELTDALGASPTGPIAGDQAIQANQRDRAYLSLNRPSRSYGPVPIVAAAMSRPAVRRAAVHGVGILTDGLSNREHIAGLLGHYRSEGGVGPCVLTRWVWVGGADPTQMEAENSRYRGYTSTGRQASFADGIDRITGSADRVADALGAALAQTGATSLNLRVHAEGALPEHVLEQIALIGAEVLPQVRAA
jgi:alkanesulfonate monooxygenase SsuD/methylene tetrahydromethanopterin reductase-like flavin-dependent oxidoreductase (luciferase family)